MQWDQDLGSEFNEIKPNMDRLGQNETKHKNTLDFHTIDRKT